MTLRDLDYHNTNDCIIVDLCFNTYTWMNDSCSASNWSYLMNVVCRNCWGEATNVGKISLIGYGTVVMGFCRCYTDFLDVFHRAVARMPYLGWRQ